MLTSLCGSLWSILGSTAEMRMIQFRFYLKTVTLRILCTRQDSVPQVSKVQRASIAGSRVGRALEAHWYARTRVLSIISPEAALQPLICGLYYVKYIEAVKYHWTRSTWWTESCSETRFRCCFSSVQRGCCLLASISIVCRYLSKERTFFGS